MQKIYFSIALMSSMIILPSEITHVVKDQKKPNEKTPLIQKYPSLTLGNKTFTAQELNGLDQKDYAALKKIAQPSCLFRCYGLNNERIQPKDLAIVQQIFAKYPQLQSDFHINVKNRNSAACSCNPQESFSCTYLDTFGRCASFSTLGFVALATIKSSWQTIATYVGASCLASIPLGCCAVETCNCLHYRYCTDEKKYQIK